tara:strand:+ start:39 stop:248 length:210 start_codon:yes stop_codon:yes gene_type:complete
MSNQGASGANLPSAQATQQEVQADPNTESNEGVDPDQSCPYTSPAGFIEAKKMFAELAINVQHIKSNSA